MSPKTKIDIDLGVLLSTVIQDYQHIKSMTFKGATRMIHFFLSLSSKNLEITVEKENDETLCYKYTNIYIPGA